MSIGQRLRDIRQKTGLSVANFANTLGEKEYKIRDSESEKQKISNDLLEKIGISYNIDLNWLLTGKGSMYLEEKKSNGNVDTGFQDCEINNNKGSIAINISKSDFKDDSAEVEELISLLKYAPKSFIIKIIEKLRAFKELSQI